MSGSSGGSGAEMTREGESQKVIGDFLVIWKVAKDRPPEFYIFHDHREKEGGNLWKYCQTDESKETFTCRKCGENAPAGVVYFGKTRALSDEE